MKASETPKRDKSSSMRPYTRSRKDEGPATITKNKEFKQLMKLNEMRQDKRNTEKLTIIEEFQRNWRGAQPESKGWGDAIDPHTQSQPIFGSKSQSTPIFQPFCFNLQFENQKFVI